MPANEWVNQVLMLAEPFIKGSEGLSLKPYLDSAGVATIGWGSILYSSGIPVQISDPPITEDIAQILLEQEMKKKLSAIIHFMTHSPTIEQAAAMLSLTYNIGVGGFAGSSVLKFFNAGDTLKAGESFLLWDKARVDGKLVEIQGLRNRREREMALFLTVI